MATINQLTGQTRKFAEACYSENSLSELMQAYNESPDRTDCREWAIDGHEWLLAIEAALAQRLADNPPDPLEDQRHV